MNAVNPVQPTRLASNMVIYKMVLGEPFKENHLELIGPARG
jgi:hypothetical protein